MIAAETYFELLRSLPHWGIELTVEGVTLLVGLLWGRVWVRRHDARHHAIPQGPPGPMGGTPDLSHLTQRVERIEARLEAELKARLAEDNAVADDLAAKVLCLKAEIERYRSAYHREIDARHGAQDMLNDARAEINALAEAVNRDQEIIEGLREEIAAEACEAVGDGDHDYIHESAQEAYDNEQRDGNDV